jgi:hypothetical protein
MIYSYKLLREQGICVACRTNLTVDNKVLCQSCSAARVKRAKEIRKFNKHSHRCCYGCKKHLSNPNDKFIDIVNGEMIVVCSDCMDFCESMNCDECHSKIHKGFIGECAYYQRRKK